MLFHHYFLHKKLLPHCDPTYQGVQVLVVIQNGKFCATGLDMDCVCGLRFIQGGEL